jgi:hypothetical protein
MEPVTDIGEWSCCQVVVPLAANGFVTNEPSPAQHLKVLSNGWAAQLKPPRETARSLRAIG